MNRPARLGEDRTEAARSWFATNTLSPDDLTESEASPRASATVVIPARDEARTIGRICRTLAEEAIGTSIDYLLVIDCDSSDRTSQIAASNGARVLHVGDLVPDVPWVVGKGETLWRSLAAVDTDLVCFIDGDIRNFDTRFVTRLLAPLRDDEQICFTKGFYRRPLKEDGGLVPAAGGRVTELAARPLLNILYPELAGFLQPLAGEYAGRADHLRALPFFTGYGVDVGLLIDFAATYGLESMAQVDLDERVHRNRPLRELREMATVIADTILRRAHRDGRADLSRAFDGRTLLPGADGSLDVADVDQPERPPMGDVCTYEPRAMRRWSSGA